MADPVPRPAPRAGEVVETRVGEEIELIEAPAWRQLEVRQDVKAGDVVRTNALGQVAIVFADRTQLRLGRNSTLVVQEVSDAGARLLLEQGRLFGRAARGGSDVLIETPAATAAVRGTDWTLSVEGATTSLVVLEGAVELANPQGALVVRGGEAAAASIGQAPSRVVVVESDVREQMLVNLSLRGAFEAFAPTSLAGPELRRQAARIKAIPPDARSAEDRVVAAELALSREGRRAALAAVAEARQVPLTRSQEARLTVIEAIVAGSEQRYAEAARLFDRARPALTGEQATAAAYQSYFARSLADPTRAVAPPAPTGDRVSVVGQAIIAAFLQGVRPAYQILATAAPRFADDPVYLASLAEAAMLAGEADAARVAASRAYALDPNDPEVLAARAGIQAEVERDLDAALATLQRALALVPASADLWNDLGLLQSERGAEREAEAAFRRAIALDPIDATTRANYAVLLLEQNRIREAGEQIDAALAADPAFEVGYFARGRRKLQQGDVAAAIDDLLRATAANPAFSNGLVTLGAAYATAGEIELARQAIENADRLDPRDPLGPQYLSALAVEEYRADDAIRHAQEAVRRTRARGGDFATIASTRAFGSSLGGAYRNLTLDAWGDYWGDVVFDPFDAGGYFDRSLSGSPTLLMPNRIRQLPGPGAATGSESFGDLIQGLLLDPLALVDPNLFPSFVRSPFLEAEFGGGIVAGEGDRGHLLTGTVQALGTSPAPFAAFLSATQEEIDLSFADQDSSQLGIVGGFGVQVAPYDRIVAFATRSRQEGGLAFAELPGTRGNLSDADTTSAVLGWSHTFGHRNVLQAAVTSSWLDQDLAIDGVDPFVGIFPATLDVGGEQDWMALGASHLVGLGPVTLRYGAEVGRLATTSDLSLTIHLPDPLGGPVTQEISSEDDERSTRRVWLDALVEVAPNLRLQTGIVASEIENGTEEDDSSLAPRLGVAWTPAEGHLLRAAHIVEGVLPREATLAPTGLLGLDPARLPLESGESRSTILAWDAEWSPHFFTSAEYQHVEADGFALGVAGALDPLPVSDPRFDRLTLTANVWLTRGVGLSGTLARTWSEADVLGRQGAIPYLPDTAARLALTHVNPAGFRLELGETWLGRRETGPGGDDLDGVWVGDARASWESPGRRWSVEIGVSNLFDADYEVAPGIGGVGRTSTAVVTARF